MLPNLLYSVAQVKEIDRLAGNSDGLMLKAGLAAFEKIKLIWPEITNLIIVCGPGKNGGDGLRLAQIAADNNYDVNVIRVDQIKDFKDLIDIYHNKKTIVVDALFGIGLNKPPVGIYKTAIEFINSFNLIFALDIPSGLDANTGIAYTPSVKATATICFIALKQGLFTNDGPDCVGNLFFADLGVDYKIFNLVDYSAWLLTQDWAEGTIKKCLPLRPRKSYKHQFGHVAVVGGSKNMPGAIVMAGTAAMRVGAGLVSLITDNSHRVWLEKNQPELMIYDIDDFNENTSKLVNFFVNSTVIVIGPGLGNTEQAKNNFNFIFRSILENLDQLNNLKAVIIDADGLRFLAEYISNENNLALILKLNDKLILTPHPGEARSLLAGCNIEDRFTTVKQIASKYNATVILKGVGTLVFNINNKVAVCSVGNPGMASAGMGDILTGIIAGLIAQGVDNYIASELAVYLHARAGDLQAKKFGERGILATDLLLDIRKLLNFH